MRLIDADALIEKINELAEGNEDYVQRYITLLAARGLVQDAPTAYDIDKVVKELKSIKGKACNGVECMKCVYNQTCYEGEMSEEVAIDNAIDIVRKGGVE